jgi:hypothetical protein
MAELAAKLLGRGDDQVVELLQGCMARFQRAGPDDLQLTDRFHDPARLFWDRGRGPAERCPGGQLGIDRVALAEPLPRMPVRLLTSTTLIPPARKARTSPAA